MKDVDANGQPDLKKLTNDFKNMRNLNVSKAGGRVDRLAQALGGDEKLADQMVGDLAKAEKLGNQAKYLKLLRYYLTYKAVKGATGVHLPIGVLDTVL